MDNSNLTPDEMLTDLLRYGKIKHDQSKQCFYFNYFDRNGDIQTITGDLIKDVYIKFTQLACFNFASSKLVHFEDVKLYKE